ncbi:MAG TPA: hypothetical protein VEC37_18960 [Bacillota bacterium]|nr:hypothetical protein [Bacillota bacterium]
MSDNVLAAKQFNNSTLQKQKPRYTEAENEILFESWWNPQKRRELVTHLGRKMSALRSQFCRLLKDKGLSNQDYYNMMHAKYSNVSGVAPRKRSRELKDVDRMILDTFAKHQALGNSRTVACDELQEKLGKSFSAAALKLRFYRLMKRLDYTEEDLLKLGKEVLGEKTLPLSSVKLEPNNVIARPEPFAQTSDMEVSIFAEPPITTPSSDTSFFYQLSSLPQTIKGIEDRVAVIESSQRHQLDLRGFIEHLLAVERDLKREDKLMEEIQNLMDENERLQRLVKKEQERLKKRENELAEVYKMLDTMLSDFMRLESVSKLASLGDFMHRLEITVDQFGNVLKSRRIEPDTH